MTPVLFLHGLGQTPQDWQDQVVALPPGTPMLAPWLPGLRPGVAEPFELDGAVSALVQLLEGRGVDRAAVVVVSLGAVVATRLAARHPGLVDRLVLCGGLVKPPRMLMRLQARALRAAPAESFGGLKDQVVAAAGALVGLDLRADLAEIWAPTLVLVGAGDRAGLLTGRQLAAGINDARLETIPGGQRLNTDNPDGFNRALVEFLS